MAGSSGGRRAVGRAYGAGASTYAERFADDFVTNKSDRAVVGQFLHGLGAGARVLDGGCGPGQLAALARQQGVSPVALDITMEMLAIARQQLE